MLPGASTRSDPFDTPRRESQAVLSPPRPHTNLPLGLATPPAAGAVKMSIALILSVRIASSSF